ncbi:hypothetical protein CGZ80_08655 [Rhodopirellula sp. MGV]|nr:hypothetical protein CGZ80_08655 [Rhodopirellula sp. MGV]PNY38396.1 DUF2585 domain-containing protein [Rhodopirellula baltica]
MPTPLPNADSPKSNASPCRSSAGLESDQRATFPIDRWSVSGAALIATAMATILYFMGRQVWCDCGNPTPWSWEVNSSHNSQHFIDPYTFTHVLHGVVFFAILWLFRSASIPWFGRAIPLLPAQRLLIALLIEAAWEILENTPLVIDRYRAATISLDYYGDSIANSLADLASCLIGYLIASRLRWQSSLVLFVVTEVVLMATIRDSLILNVIMLVFPNEAILRWQAA